jgi:hypothetical protein
MAKGGTNRKTGSRPKSAMKMIKEMDRTTTAIVLTRPMLGVTRKADFDTDVSFLKTACLASPQSARVRTRLISQRHSYCIFLVIPVWPSRNTHVLPFNEHKTPSGVKWWETVIKDGGVLTKDEVSNKMYFILSGMIRATRRQATAKTVRRGTFLFGGSRREDSGELFKQAYE